MRYAFTQRYPDGIASIVVGGAAPNSPKLEENRIRRSARAITAGEQTFAEGDPKALAAARLGLLSWDGVAPETLTVPSLLYAGGDAPVMRGTPVAAQAMPNTDFRLVSGLSHQGVWQSDEAIPMVRDILKAQAGVERQGPSGT